jgi:Pyruvate/2-oxoglutarate dehydrogenase complex, dehydrogenase (E1) component, eukaryotic type, beta subunit
MYTFIFDPIQLTVREALGSAMADEIERDPRVFLMGVALFSLG